MLKQGLNVRLWQIISDLEYREHMDSAPLRGGCKCGLGHLSTPLCESLLFSSPGCGGRPGAHSGSSSWWQCGWGAFFQTHRRPPKVMEGTLLQMGMRCPARSKRLPGRQGRCCFHSGIYHTGTHILTHTHSRTHIEHFCFPTFSILEFHLKFVFTTKVCKPLFYSFLI